MTKLLVVLALVSGCSFLQTPPCRTAAAVMEEKVRNEGNVLFCYKYTYPDSGVEADRCMVYLPKTDRVVEKTVFARHCGL